MIRINRTTFKDMQKRLHEIDRLNKVKDILVALSIGAVVAIVCLGNSLYQAIH